MLLKTVAIGSLVLLMLGGCSRLQHNVKESTPERLANQYDFENRYTDVDDPD